MSERTWTPDSWRGKSASQEVVYPDTEALDRVVGTMAKLPPLVTSWEVEALKSKLAQAATGQAFLLQGGDCAEQFDECTSQNIAAKLKILLQMSLVLVYGTRRQVIRVGRIAGQYAKPRSSNNEQRGDVTLPAYRGDLVNRLGFTEEDRTPNPELLLAGFQRAALTLNFIRALMEEGFADLHHPENWDLSFSHHVRHGDEYRRIVDFIRDAISFVETLSDVDQAQLRRVEFYTSHEALSLNYETPLTRQVPRRHGWYNLSTHLPWIGMRTADPDGAHVEYCRGIKNPIGIKIGAGMTPEWLEELLDRLHPDNEPGRLTLIQRFGVNKVADSLPALIETVRKSGKTVLWCADPMHGNTETTSEGIKTRRFENILGELEQAFDIHREMGSILGGVHFELTGDDVTECIGGARGLEAIDLHRAYQSKVDPRLNYEQALEMAMLVARRLRQTPVVQTAG